MKKRTHIAAAFAVIALLAGYLLTAPHSLVRGVGAQEASKREHAQDARGVTNQPGSDGAMYRANLQRTGVFRTKGVPVLNGKLWESTKLFTMKREKVVTEMGRDLNLLGVGMVYFPGRAWHYDTDYSYSDPVVAGGTIYFTLYIGDGYLYALDTATGNVKWRAKRPGGSFTYPCVAGDSLYVGSGGPDGSFFYAMNLKTQEEKWRYKLGDKNPSISPASVADGVVYFATGDGGFHALDAETGRKKWGFETKQENRLTVPAVANGIIYFGDKEGLLRALDAGTGQERWKLKTKSGVWSLAVSGGVLYVRNFEGKISGVDIKAGRLLPDTFKDVKAGTPLAIDSQTIYYGDWKGENVYAVDAATGKQKWKFETADRCRAPVIAEGVVYFSCSDGKLYAVDAGTGKMKWALAGEKSDQSNPAIADGVIYYINDDGHVYAIK